MKGAVIALAACALLTACGSIRFAVPYPSVGTPARTPGAANEIVNVVAKDDRTDPGGAVGRNGWQTLVPSNDPAGALAGGMRAELAARGYTVAPGHAQATLDLVSFAVDFLPNDLPLQASPGAPGGTVIATVGIIVIVRDPVARPVFAHYLQVHAAKPYYFNTSNAPDARTVLSEAMQSAITGMIADPAFQQAARRAQ